MDDLVAKLKDLGFNTYEAKVYLALLKHHPATGYEISKESGVPQARAYDTLKALENNKVVVAIGDKPTTYMPITPSELLDRWERSFKGSINYLREALPSMSGDMVEPVINIRGEESIFTHARDMIDNAKKTLFLELWKEDADRLSESLQAAVQRGVDLKIVGYDHLEFGFTEVYQHGLARTIENSLGGRWLILSADEKEGIVGNIPQGDRAPQAVYTRNPGIVLIIKELIVHDIFLLDVENNLQDQMEKVYGKNLMKLRQKILGDEALVGGAH